MQASDAGHAIKRLQELAGMGPGANPAALTEAHTILSGLGQGSASGYLSEKLMSTAASFETWLGALSVAQAGGDAESLRSLLMTDIEKLRKALARGATGQD